MRHRRKNRNIKVIAVTVTLVFVSALVLGIISSFRDIDSRAPGEKALAQQKDDTAAGQSGGADTSNTTVEYMTISKKDDIDIVVNYLTPVTGDNDFLTFEVTIGTHFVNLTKYRDIGEYAELRTDTGLVISEGFEWFLESFENHHISGVLKIKNDFQGKPVVGQDTKSFELIFKNIPDASERVHLYEGEKLK